jgi:hypothetical protein
VVAELSLHTRLLGRFADQAGVRDDVAARGVIAQLRTLARETSP